MTFFLITILSIFLFLSSSTTTSTACTSKIFTTFDNCNDLPTLDAVLHWTYTPSTSSLSVAFTAMPPSPDGWVSWALNPTSTGMVGAQSIIAFRPTPSGPISASTYDIQSYSSIIKGPISYVVSNLSVEESNGRVTVFSTWQLPVGSESVNQVWQVGPVVNGRPGEHEFDPDNMKSTMKLSLGLGSKPASSPVGPRVGYSDTGTGMGGAGVMGSFGLSFVSILGVGVFLVSLF